MPDYKYRIIGEDGKVSRGKINATSKTNALENLKRNNNQPIMIKKMNESVIKRRRVDYNKINAEAINEREKERKKNKPKKDISQMTFDDLKKIDVHLPTKIKTRDIVILVNNLYILKKAKFNNLQALKSVFESVENPALKDVVEDLLIGVEAGERLYSVMSNYPKVFPPMFVNFIRVGEESGTLDTALLYARDYIEESSRLTKQIKSAIIPRVLQFVGIMAGMMAALLFGVPMLENVYEMFGSDKEIPKATQIGMDVAKWIVANWYIVVGVLGSLAVAFYVWISTPMGRYRWDKFKLTCPVIGPLLTNITINKFFQAMLLNLKNGMRIQESLEVSKNVSSNYYFLSAVQAGKTNSLEGKSWLTPFEEKKLFKPMVSQMITIGMQTDLPEMMEKVNEYIKMQIDETLAIFVKVLPDVTYLFVGIALIAFCITVMVPLTEVYMGGMITM